MVRVQPPNGIGKAELAYQYILENILNGTFAPGAPLSIRELSAQINVSRTPVKEAINRLAYEGYADLYPDRTAIVSKISYVDVVEMLELRECLESSAAYYAALRRTDREAEELAQILQGYWGSLPGQNLREISDWDWKFHNKIASIAKNHRLEASVGNIAQAFSRITLPISTEDRSHRSGLQHEAIFSAIRDGSPEVARIHMLEHIKDILLTVQDYQRKNLHLFR